MAYVYEEASVSDDIREGKQSNPLSEKHGESLCKFAHPPRRATCSYVLHPHAPLALAPRGLQYLFIADFD